MSCPTVWYEAYLFYFILFFLLPSPNLTHPLWLFLMNLLDDVLLLDSLFHTESEVIFVILSRIFNLYVVPLKSKSWWSLHFVSFPITFTNVVRKADKPWIIACFTYQVSEGYDSHKFNIGMVSCSQRKTNSYWMDLQNLHS